MLRSTRFPLLALCLLLYLSSHASAQGSGVIEVALRSLDGYPVVPVLAPDGSELLFGLGTASPSSVLAESTLDRFGESAELTFGGIPVGLRGHQTRADEALARGGHRIDGLIGAGTLADYDILVDLPGGHLLLREVRPANWAGFELADPVSVQVLHGAVVALQSRVAGSEFFTMLDLASGTNVFSPALGDKLGLAAAGDATIGIGDIELVSQPYEVQDLAVFRMFDRDGNGFVILGPPILRDCALAISWARREIRTCAR